MRTEVELMPEPVRRGIAPEGPVECAQSALLTVDEEVFEQIWTPSTLESLARSYWSFLRKRSFGAIRVIYSPDSRTVVLLSRRIPLLRFGAPHFSTGSESAAVKWPIEEGLLVARAGRRQGFLRIEARRQTGVDVQRGRKKLLVTSEVSNFYPWIRGTGLFSRFGGWVYSQTQLRAHIWITRGFLRSLPRLPNEVLSDARPPGPGNG